MPWRRLSEADAIEMEELLRWGAYGALKGDDEALHRFCESDIDSLLRGAAEDVTAGREAAGGSTFARASFMPQAAGAEEELLLDDPNFWSKLQRIPQQQERRGGDNPNLN